MSDYTDRREHVIGVLTSIHTNSLLKQNAERYWTEWFDRYEARIVKEVNHG